MSSHGLVAPWQALAHTLDGAPDFDDLDWCLLDADLGYYLRVNQRPSNDDWRYLGMIAGRGFGKSKCLARIVTREILSGRVTKLGLMAQDDDQTIKVQVEPLIEAAPPWCKCEMFLDELVWENGAKATLYTPQSPGAIRGFNGELAWISEMVAWPHKTRQEAFSNLLTATREGNARILWDTTSKGRNELVNYLLALNESKPDKYPIIRGTIFDNPVLGRDYLNEQCRLYHGRRREEELEGKTFLEAEGAIFEQAWIDIARVDSAPRLELSVVGLDPGISINEGVDGSGITTVGRSDSGEVYVTRTQDAVLSPDQYASVVVDECIKGAAGAVVETNRGGMTIASVITAAAQHKGLETRKLKHDEKFRRTPGVVYIREVHSRGAKLSRAGGPSVLVKNGRVHMVGVHSELENQMCTYDGDGESPNLLDSFSMAVIEVAELNSNKPSREVQKHQASQAKQVNERLRQSYSVRQKTRPVGL